MDHLKVDADQAYNTSRAVGNDAQELREELAGLQRDWDNLSREWSGVASSAYSGGIGFFAATNAGGSGAWSGRVIHAAATKAAIMKAIPR